MVKYNNGFPSKFLIIATVFIIWLSCTHQPLEPEVVQNNCSTDSVYFKQQILTLVHSSCGISGCHDAITKQSGVQLTNYTTIIAKVTPRVPMQSRLFLRIISPSSRMPPIPHPALENDEVANIEKWIRQGALNNSCVSDNCDTMEVSYKNDIIPIIQRSCRGCHNPQRKSANMDLTNYAWVNSIATSNLLLKVIDSTKAFKFMPKGSIKLDDCTRNKIRSWVNAGAKDN